MTTYRMDSTGRFIGECVVCKQRYYAASVDEMRTASVTPDARTRSAPIVCVSALARTTARDGLPFRWTPDA